MNTSPERRWGDRPHCEICGTQTHWPTATIYSTCKPIVDRMDFRGRADKAAWRQALKRSWDPEAGCFRCHYTTIPLVVDRTTSLHPRYLQREHLVPGNQGR